MTQTATDLRGLEPPEPMLRILETIEEGAHGPHVFLLAREPYPLYPLLAADGWSRRLRALDAGVELVLFREPRARIDLP